MNEREVILERRRIEKLFKRVNKDYKELKSSIYMMYSTSRFYFIQYPVRL